MQQTFKPSINRIVQSIGVERALNSIVPPVPEFKLGEVRRKTKETIYNQKMNSISANLDFKENAHLSLSDIFKHQVGIEVKHQKLC